MLNQHSAVGAVAAYRSILELGRRGPLGLLYGPGGASHCRAAVKRQRRLGAGVEADGGVVFGGLAGEGAFVVVVFDFLFVVFGDLVGFADGVAVEVFGLHLDEVGAAQVGQRELAEDVVDDRGRHLDVGVALDRAVRLEAGEDEGFRELLKRHAVLEAEGDRDGEAVHQRPEGGAFAVHVDEDLAEGAVLELAGSEVDLVAADSGLLGIALSTTREGAAAGDVAVDELGGDFGDGVGGVEVLGC